MTLEPRLYHAVFSVMASEQLFAVTCLTCKAAALGSQRTRSTGLFGSDEVMSLWAETVVLELYFVEVPYLLAFAGSMFYQEMLGVLSWRGVKESNNIFIPLGLL